MIRGGPQARKEHPDFPSIVYGYVSFRSRNAEPDRLGRHAYSTPFETDWFQLGSRVARLSRNNDRVEPTFLIAQFELVSVEAIDSRNRDDR